MFDVLVFIHSLVLRLGYGTLLTLARSMEGVSFSAADRWICAGRQSP